MELKVPTIFSVFRKHHLSLIRAIVDEIICKLAKAAKIVSTRKNIDIYETLAVSQKKHPAESKPISFIVITDETPGQNEVHAAPTILLHFKLFHNAIFNRIPFFTQN